MLPAWTVKPKYWPVLSVTRLFRPLPSIFAISILRKYASPQYITPAESQTRSSANVTSVNTSYFKQLKYCYLMTTFWCSSDILITSWLFTARWSTWPGNHLVPCVAELVGSCVPIHERRCLPDPKCLFYPSGLSLCLSVDHFCLVPVNDMVLFHGMVCDGWLVSYTALPCPGGSGLCTSCKKSTSFLCSLILRPNFLPVVPMYEPHMGPDDSQVMCSIEL